jgi:hypothetical protein
VKEREGREGKRKKREGKERWCHRKWPGTKLREGGDKKTSYQHNGGD